MYRVYIFDDMEHFTDADFATACTMVSALRRSKAMAFRRAADRKQSVVAELLLRHALRDAFSIAVLPEIRCGAHGKPMFADHRSPAFNLSHCSLAVACVVADEEVGVDVEPYASYNMEVAREVFCEGELRQATGSPAIFCELWTKKESYLKYTGEGLTDALKGLLDNAGEVRFHTFHSRRGYACTVCAKNINPALPTFVDKTTLLYGGYSIS